MPPHGKPQRRRKYISQKDNLDLTDFKRDFEQEIYEESTSGDYARVDSRKNEHFTNLIPTNESEEENLKINSSRIIIQNVTILSSQQLNYRLWIYGTDEFYNETEVDRTKLVDFINFDLPTNGVRYKNTGMYMYTITNLEMLYNDLNQKSELHLALENLSASSKNPPDSYVIIQVMYREMNEV